MIPTFTAMSFHPWSVRFVVKHRDQITSYCQLNTQMACKSEIHETVHVDMPEIRGFLGGQAHCEITCRLREFHQSDKRWEVELVSVNEMGWILFPLRLAKYQLNIDGKINLDHADIWQEIENKCKLETEYSGVYEDN